MKVSLNLIRYYQKLYNWPEDLIPADVNKLIERIGSQLGAVEGVIGLGEKYKGIIIAKVMECHKLEGSDHLNVCKIDDGGKAQNVERDEAGHVQVVCGAPNCHAGLTVVWLPPGTTVPESLDKDPYVLEAREIRGVKSNGMLASLKELGIGDGHSGILEINDDPAPGTDFAENYELAGDYEIDIENKMFTHRPDCFGFLGVAREIAGIQHKPFKSPDWYALSPEFPNIEADILKLDFKNELPELVPRFTAIAMSNIKIEPSPLRLQVELAKVGLKPINNIVDLTNYCMLLTGQPLHAYDYDKVKGLSTDDAKIVVRQPKPGEKIKLLNGKEVEPRAEAIMIATDKQLIGIGGVMGGSDTEVDENTKNIIIECASFDMYSIRRTSMEHGLFTDAVTRFSKGQSPLQNLAVLAKIVDEIHGNGGKVASEVIDNHSELPEPAEVSTSAKFINERLGLDLSAADIKQILENVEFKVYVQSEKITVTAPFWRTDIEIPEDIVEEVGRLYGYDKLPLELPNRSIMPAKKNQLLELKSEIRTKLARSGANEVLNYSFVHGDLLEKVGQNKDQAFQISNALSPGLQYYRLSITPSLLDKVHANIKAGFDEFAMFELGKAHVLGEVDSQEMEVPKEVNAVSLVYAAKKTYRGAPYYIARKYLDSILSLSSSAQLRLEPLVGADLYNNPWVEQMVAPFEPARSAVLRDAAGVLPGTKGLIWGVVGEFKLVVRRALKLPEYTAGFEIDPLLLSPAHTARSYVALSRFPKVTQDITLKVAVDLPYQDIHGFMLQKLQDIKPENCHVSIRPIDIFQREDDKPHKQITFRLTISSYERTLTDSEVSKLLDEVAKTAQDKLKAMRI